MSAETLQSAYFFRGALIWVDVARAVKVSFFVFTIREFNLLARLKQRGSSLSYHVERSGEYALVIVFACDNLETFEDIIRYTIYDAMYFIDRDMSGHLDRSQLPAWWGAIIEDAAKLSTSPAKVVQSVEKAKSWLVQQVALAIATVLASFNGQTEEWWKFLWKVVLQGEDRMKDMISTLKYLSEIQRGILAEIHKKGFAY
jgi:hypothetical protein